MNGEEKCNMEKVLVYFEINVFAGIIEACYSSIMMSFCYVSKVIVGYKHCILGLV